MMLLNYIKSFNDGGIKRPKNVSQDAWDTAMQVYNTAKSVGDKFPELTLAQSILETGWFKSPSGDFNFFGQKATANQEGTVKSTREVYNGTSQQVQERFRDYDSLEAALEDRQRKWGSKYEDANTVEDALYSIWQYDEDKKQGVGYATDTEYDKKVINILNMIGASPDKKTSAPVESSLAGYTHPVFDIETNTQRPNRVSNTPPTTQQEAVTSEETATAEQPPLTERNISGFARQYLAENPDTSSKEYAKVLASLEKQRQEELEEETKQVEKTNKEILQAEQQKKQQALDLLAVKPDNNESYNNKIASAPPQQMQPFRLQTDWWQPQYKKGGVLEKMVGKIKPQMQSGGEIITSQNGLYDYPDAEMVLVPTKDGRITMKGINHLVKGIADTGEEILMEPNKEYHFKGAKTVLEIPQRNG